MRRPAALFPIVPALGAMIFASRGGAQAQNTREEGPIEIEKCRTIDKPGSYRLVNNLTSTAITGACLSITTDFVTIDLAGFTITGNGMGGGAAIRAAPPSLGRLNQIAVRNGSISGALVGVDLSAADGSIVEGLRVFVAGIGISAKGIVKGNIVRTATTGIIATGVVTGNYANFNLFGMDIGQGSTVIGNTATDNTEGGISVSCPSNLTDNTAVNNFTNLVLHGDGCHNEDNVAP